MQSSHTSWIIRFSYTEAMDIIKSQKGKQQLLYEGYRYRRDKLNQDGSSSWRCIKRSNSNSNFFRFYCARHRAFVRRDFIVANLSARFWRRVLIGAILSARICLSRNCRVTDVANGDNIDRVNKHCHLCVSMRYRSVNSKKSRRAACVWSQVGRWPLCHMQARQR